MSNKLKISFRGKMKHLTPLAHLQPKGQLSELHYQSAMSSPHFQILPQPFQTLTTKISKSRGSSHTVRLQKLLVARKQIRQQKKTYFQFFQKIVPRKIQNQRLKSITRIRRQKSLWKCNDSGIYKINHDQQNQGTILPYFKNNEHDQHMHNKPQIVYYIDFVSAISLSNGIKFQYGPSPSIFVGKGNNGRLVKSILRSRTWLSIAAEPQSANFVWSCRRRASYSSCDVMALRSLQDQSELDILGAKSNLIQRLIQVQESKHGKEKPPFVVRPCQTVLNSNRIFFQNMLPNSEALSTKKGLYYSLCNYYGATNKNLADTIPFTLHVCSMNELKSQAVAAHFKDQKKSLWIVKPAQNTNRGQGIFLAKDLRQIRKQISFASEHTFILQRYIQNPMLYNKRKFDLRTFLLITTVGGCVKGYFYEDGYVRTSGYQFSLGQLDERIHLTNDAKQKDYENYGKFQSANKLSLADLRAYLHERGFSFEKVWRRIRQISREVVESCWDRLGAQQVQVSFELFGLDFMLDAQGRTFLIQVNQNPCLEVSGSLLSVVIPALVENALKVGLDPVFPPPSFRRLSRNLWWLKNCYEQNRFTLIFDSQRLPDQFQF